MNHSRAIVPVTVIICSRNRPLMLGETIASICRGTMLPQELLVVDQSDQPHPHLQVGGRWAAAAPVPLRYVSVSSVGLCRANNLAVRLAHCERLIFTHDDVLVAPDWLEKLSAALRCGAPGTVVTGRILASSPEVNGGFAPTLRTDVKSAIYRGRIGIDVLKPLNMGLERAWLIKVGGFDERLGPGTPYPGAEDSDLGFRLLEAGYQIEYVPGAIVYHRAWRHGKDYLPLRWHYGVAQGAFFAKHLRRDDRYMLRRLLRDTRRRARRFPRRLLRERSRALGDPLFLLGNLVGAAHWFLNEKREQKGSRACRSDEMTMEEQRDLS